MGTACFVHINVHEIGMVGIVQNCPFKKSWGSAVVSRSSFVGSSKQPASSSSTSTSQPQQSVSDHLRRLSIYSSAYISHSACPSQWPSTIPYYLSSVSFSVPTPCMSSTRWDKTYTMTTIQMMSFGRCVILMPSGPVVGE